MFILDRTTRNFRINFWIDEPQHYTLFNVAVLGFSFFSIFIMAEIGVGFTLLGFSFILHFPRFRKQFDNFHEAQRQEKEKLASPQVRALKKKRKK